jgi:UDP-N-acetylmuramyl tripeptide synthase
VIFAAKVALSRLVGAVSRRLGRGGTSLPGKILLRLDRRGLARLARGLDRGAVVISATNGKTTTAAMAAAVLERAGARVVHNRAGANMAGGVASAMLDASRRDGGLAGDTGLFEVDEFWLDRVVADLEPRAIVLGNLFRDQLDRYGELETIADRWSAVLAASAPSRTQLVLNADDPLVADLGRERHDVVYFGIEDPSAALAGLEHAADSKHCRRCGAPYRYDVVFLGHLGHYRCDACGARRPTPTVAAEAIRLDGIRSATVALRAGSERAEVTIGVPGLYNVYNALAAAALGVVWGLPLTEVAEALGSVRPAFGRAETVELDGRELSILLVKNPAGANEVLRTLALEPGEHQLLAVLNDLTADGKDVSWVWDADFELLASRLAGVTCSGTRAAELAVRLKYAGVAPERIAVEPELERALDTAVRAGTGTLYAIPTYTAMLSLRELLVDRGSAVSSWR